MELCQLSMDALSKVLPLRYATGFLFHLEQPLKSLENTSGLASKKDFEATVNMFLVLNWKTLP